jgi:hypothetical protein
MKKKPSNWLPIVMIPLGGMIMLALVFLGYLALNIFTETVIYGGNYQLVKVDLLRRGFAIFAMLVYFATEWTKWPDWIKATIMVGPFTMVLITVVLQYYQNMTLALAGVALLVIISIVILQRLKKPWFFY